MMEAALQEKSIVCFAKSGGASEFVEGDAGFVVPGFDVDEMAQRVLDLLSSPELCKRLGSAARQKVLDHHSISVGAPKIATIIQDALLVRENQQDNARSLQAEQEISTR
jgi:glycosyltransferase involved in cell wall biosynthesis